MDKDVREAIRRLSRATVGKFSTSSPDPKKPKQTYVEVQESVVTSKTNMQGNKPDPIISELKEIQRHMARNLLKLRDIIHELEVQ